MAYLNILVKEGVVFLKAIWTNENNFRLRFKKSKFSCLLTVRLLKISNKRVGFFLVFFGNETSAQQFFPSAS